MDLPLKAQPWRMFKTHVFEIRNMVLVRVADGREEEKKTQTFRLD
jgi:hypothetical protein